MQKGKLNRIGLAVFYILCLIAAIAFVSYHLYGLLASDIVTVRAEKKHVEDVDIRVGYLARDERPLAIPSGALLYAGENGAKLKEGDVCVSVYADGMKTTLDRIALLERESAILNNALYYTTLEQSSSDADIAYKELMDSLSHSDISVSDVADSLVGAQLSADYVFDRDAIRQAKKKIDAEAEDLKSTLGLPESTVKMPMGGFFYKNGDSFSELFCADLAENASADEILSAIDNYHASADGENSQLCSMTYDSKWYILVPVSAESSKMYAKGRNYTLRLGDNASEAKAELSGVRITSDGKEACLVFSLFDVAHGFDYGRSFEVEIVSAEYDCYRIPFSALRQAEDGSYGVYILSGGVVLFRRVEMIRSTDSYVLVSSAEDYLSRLEESKNAKEIYSSRYGDSLFTGVYPGGAYPYFEKGDKLFENKLNISGPEMTVTIDILEDSESFKYSYLEENEFVIIKGSSLYHGKIPG